MKTKKMLLGIIALWTFSTQGFGCYNLKLTIIDSFGEKDSVLFGFCRDATSGIDSKYKEENIFGIAIDSLEIRSIQRNLDSQTCSTEDLTPVVFQNNIDLKIDYRNQGNMTNWLERNFEFEVSAYNYPVKAFISIDNFDGLYRLSSGFGLWDTTCNSIDGYGLFLGEYLLFELQDSSQRYIRFYVGDAYVGLGNNTKPNNLPVISYNVHTNHLDIINLPKEKVFIEITSLLGYRIANVSNYAYEGHLTIELPTLPAGSYIISVFDNNKNNLVNKSIIAY